MMYHCERVPNSDKVINVRRKLVVCLSTKECALMRSQFSFDIFIMNINEKQT